MKMTKVKFDVFQKLVKKLRECMRANRRLNAQIKEANKMNKKG